MALWAEGWWKAAPWEVEWRAVAAKWQAAELQAVALSEVPLRAAAMWVVAPSAAR